MLTGKPEHLATFDYRGLHRYFLTFCTAHRRQVPVRAGLAKSVSEYPFLGSSIYTVEQILDAVQLDAGWQSKSD